jgi:mannose-6-phosphate isomerase
MNEIQIIQKPWGHEQIVEANDNYVVKKLTMKAGHRCSLQYHNVKRETIYVISGRLMIIHGIRENDLESKLFHPGDVITIPPKLIHRMEAIDDSVYLEASTPELDDVVRISDDYERQQP